MQSPTAATAGVIRRAVPMLAALCWLIGATPSPAQLIYSDSFNYPDGILVGASGSPWVNNYFETNIATVQNGRLFLSQHYEEGIRVDFPEAYDTGRLYAKFQVTVTELPTGIGNYFACFRQSYTDNNRGRIHISTANSAPGHFQLGVSSFSNYGYLVPQDLSLGQPYTVVLRYNLTNYAAALWLDPNRESDTQRFLEDTNTTPIFIATKHFVFIQSSTLFTGSGMGNLFLDNLRIARSFNEALYETRITGIAPTVQGYMSVRASGIPTTNYVLQANTNLIGPNWINLATNAADSSGNLIFSDAAAPGFPTRFYRLQAQ